MTLLSLVLPLGGDLWENLVETVRRVGKIRWCFTWTVFPCPRRGAVHNSALCTPSRRVAPPSDRVWEENHRSFIRMARYQGHDRCRVISFLSQEKGMEGQGALEYLLILAAVLITVAGVVSILYYSSSSLFSTVRQQLDNVLENEILPSLSALSLFRGAPLPNTLTTGFLVRLPALSTR